MPIVESPQHNRFWNGRYKDTLMEQLANKGDGNYYYIDTEKEADKVCGRIHSVIRLHEM